MIDSRDSRVYLCGSAHTPSPASFTCFQAGCTAYAFICGRRSCDCVTTHGRHAMMCIKDVLEEALKPVGVVGEIANSGKEIITILEDLWKQLEQLQVKHKTHVAKFAEGKLKSGPLRRKLAQMAPLYRNEATGDGFFKLMNEGDA